MPGYKELIVWQKSLLLARVIYDLTEHFPKAEIYGLTSQMRRCGVSIPSNIAEGSRRATTKEITQFLRIAYGSGAELETQIEIVKALPFGQACDFAQAESLLNEVMRMLNVMIQKRTSTNYVLRTTH